MRQTRRMLHHFGAHGIEEKSFTVSTDLPDLDEDVSFVVDNGEPTGPMPMRVIIDSIRSGERAPDVLVWWAGASEWLSFASDQRLFELLQVLPATNQPPPPPEIDEVPEAVEASSFPEPEVSSFDMPSEEAAAEPFELEPETFSTDLEAEQSSSEGEIADIDPGIEAEADALLARSPRELHPSAGWGIDDEPEADLAVEPAELAVDSVTEQSPVEVEADAYVEVVETVSDVDVAEETEADDYVDVVETVSDVEDVEETEHAEEVDAEQLDVVEPIHADVAAEAGLVGLFSAGARGGAVREQAAPIESLEAPAPKRSSLENVGARIDALTTATRRAQRLDHSGDDPDFLGREPQTGSWQAVDETSAAPSSPMDQRFAEMVRKSVEHQRRIDWATRIDELLLSASITSIVEDGFVVVDLTTIERHHHVAFDHNDDSRRVRFDLTPMSTLNAAGDPVGRHVRVALAWGREVDDADVAFAVVRDQISDDDVLPGTVTCEADVVHALAFTAVEFIWAAEDFVGNDHSVNRASLDESIEAALHALEMRWHELFTAR